MHVLQSSCTVVEICGGARLSVCTRFSIVGGARLCTARGCTFICGFGGENLYTQCSAWQVKNICVTLSSCSFVSNNGSESFSEQGAAW